ncbi:integrase, catalytic region, zinc finger, CCHC-type containing protein, partial [Tanacetum coccineum]
MITTGQKNTIAEYMILSGAENRRPMLEKDLTKKYVELSPAKKIQADCDMKAINIILQGTSLTKQERECKLYDAFDKFTHINGESLHLYYLRFTQLINDINIYNMKLEQFQVNTKFLNSLPPEWSKFVTDIKHVKDLHTTNFDQLYAYLEQHELHANEVLFIQQSSVSTIVFTISVSSIWINSSHTTLLNYLYIQPHAITYPSAPYPHAYSSIVHQEACPQPQSVPQIEYTVSTVNQQTHLDEFPQIDSSLAVPVFKQGDDPIDAINKMMSFLSTVATSRTRANTSRTGGNYSGQKRIVKCFNCQGEGHMARQCPKPKRKKDATWFREKVLLLKAQRNGKVLTEEELEFLAD